MAPETPLLKELLAPREYAPPVESPPPRSEPLTLFAGEFAPPEVVLLSNWLLTPVWDALRPVAPKNDRSVLLTPDEAPAAP